MKRPLGALLGMVMIGFALASAFPQVRPKVKVYSVPFKMQADHIIVDGKLGGATARFMIDTGMEADIVLASVAKQYGMNAQAPKGTVELGGSTVKDMEWMIYDLPALQGVYKDTGVGLILGAPFLNRHVVTFDFKKSTFAFQDAGDEEPAHPNDAIVIPYADFRGCVQLEVRINGQGPFKALLDTGSPYIRLTSDVMAKASPGSDIVSTLEVGGAKVQNMKVSTNPTLTGMMKKAGLDALIGLRFLSQFTATIDYKRKKMILVKPK